MKTIPLRLLGFLLVTAGAFAFTGCHDDDHYGRRRPVVNNYYERDRDYRHHDRRYDRDYDYRRPGYSDYRGSSSVSLNTRSGTSVTVSRRPAPTYYYDR